MRLALFFSSTYYKKYITEHNFQETKQISMVTPSTVSATYSAPENVKKTINSADLCSTMVITIMNENKNIVTKHHEQ